MTKQAVTLGALVGRVERLEVRYKRCDRAGRLQLAPLIAEHGADTGLPELGTHLAAGCLKAKATNSGERCFVYFPQLLALAGLPPAAS